MGAHRLLFNNVPDVDIHSVFRTAAVSFPCDAVDYYVYVMGNSRDVEAGETGAL